MDRCSSGFFLTLASALLVALTGCVGKSTSNFGNGTVKTVTLSPAATISVDLGTVQTFSATALNAFGQSVLTGIEFASSNNAALTIATNGQACAGTWNSLTNPTVCTPGVAGVTQVTAIAGGVTSAPTTVYVHQHIDNITIAPIGTPTYDCFSQDQTWDFQATAYSQGVDITATVGPFGFAPTNANVVTIQSNVPGLLPNQIQVTAKNPGITPIFASASGVSSSPITFTACLVSSIMLQVQGGSDNTVSLVAGSAKTIEATVLDTLKNPVSKPPLTWSTSDPLIASVSTSGGVTAKQSAGGVDISASCTPPSCNIGVLPGMPVYSSNGTLPNGQPGFGAISVNVTQSKTPTFTAWTATTGCGGAFNCTSAMFAVAPGNTPISGTVEIPRTPNSIVFQPSGTQAFVGSDQGLMIANLAASPPTVNPVSAANSPCSVVVCGRILAISSDGNRVVVSDTVTQPNQVYIFDNAHPATAPADLLIAGATAAAFSPDQMKIFILSNTGQLFVYSNVDALGSVAISGSATDLAFSADGSFAYISGTPTGASIASFSTCSLPGFPSVNLGSSPTSALPLKIFALPDVSANGQVLPPASWPSLVQNVLAVEPPNIEILKAQFTQLSIPDSQFTCNVPLVTNPPLVPVGPPINLGQGNFTPVYMQAVGNGSQFILLAKNIGAVLMVDLNGGTTSAIPLANNAVPLAASASPDGSQVYVAACESFDNNNPPNCLTGDVHIVNLQNGGDIQQVPFINPNTNNSMCSNLNPSAPPCVPNLIAVRPQ